MTLRLKAVALLAVLLVSACAEDELILEGVREPLRVGSLSDIVVNRVEPISLQPPVPNADWTHQGGSTTHSIPHPTLRQPLSLLWSVDIGNGESRQSRLSADPVVSGGRIFTLDSDSTVSAFALDGSLIWNRDLTPPDEGSDEGLGGGLAVSGETLFVTSGFGRLVALSAANGDIRWEQQFQASVTGPATIVDGTAFLSTRNGLGWAVDASEGRLLWEVVGISSNSGLVGGPAPVLAGELIVFPFASGQMIAAERDTGTPRWLASVAGQRSERVFARVNDMTGDPVVVGETLIAGTHSGRTSAFDIETGAIRWTAEEGAMSQAWVAGGSVFLLSDENFLVRMELDTGETVWRVELPFFERERQTRRKTIFAHFGPVLAGGRLVVLSDDGFIRSFDPASGALVSSQELPAGAARNPVVADGVLYVITENGRLHAFR